MDWSRGGMFAFYSPLRILLPGAEFVKGESFASVGTLGFAIAWTAEAAVATWAGIRAARFVT